MSLPFMVHSTFRKPRGEERRGEERRGETRRGETRRGETRRGETRRAQESPAQLIHTHNHTHVVNSCWTCSCCVLCVYLPSSHSAHYYNKSFAQSGPFSSDSLAITLNVCITVNVYLLVVPQGKLLSIGVYLHCSFCVIILSTITAIISLSILLLWVCL